MGDRHRRRDAPQVQGSLQFAPVLWRTLLDLVGEGQDGDPALHLTAWRDDVLHLRPPPTLTTRQVNAIVDTVLRRQAHVPALGIEIGGRQTLTSFGPAGIAMMTSPTLGEALQVGLKYQRLIGTPLLLDARYTAGEVKLHLHGGLHLHPHVEGFLAEELLSSLLAIIRSETGQDLRAARVEIARADLPLTTRLHHQRTFRNVEFGSGAYLLAFPEQALRLPLLRHDPVTHQDALQWCDRLANTHGHGTHAPTDVRVRDQLRVLPPDARRLSDVARALNLPPPHPSGTTWNCSARASGRCGPT